ncbi:MAG: MepB family protein [Oceanospirillaceae bacterium]|nr:MepB family protein [Oceanospirillaceae bacterium]
MDISNYRDEFESFLVNELVPAGFKITKAVELDAVPESCKYEALVFSLDEKRIVYRKAKVTPDRPGAFLAIWQRPSLANSHDNKPTPLTADDLDYLFIKVESCSSAAAGEGAMYNAKSGMFIFPVSLLIEKGIVSSTKNKGKTGFRVFPPWSQDRGVIGTKVFSASGKKTQRWQIPFFLAIAENGSIDAGELKKLLSH